MAGTYCSVLFSAATTARLNRHIASPAVLDHIHVMLEQLTLVQEKTFKYLSVIPQQVSIRVEYQNASQAVRTGDIVQITELYFSRIDGHFKAVDRRLNYKHVGAALYGTQQIWTAAKFRHGPNLLNQLRPELEAFLTRILVRMQHVLPDMTCRALSCQASQTA